MLFAALALLLVSPTHPMHDNVGPRVRPLDDSARAVLSSGERSSRTVAQLLTTLECSDVVVYVQTAVGLRARGLLTFMAYGTPVTYLMIRIDVRQSPRDRIATLAHELTHAVEIAEASPAVQSEADLAALYRTIGFRSATAEDFESARARANEHQAQTEQRHARPAPEDQPIDVAAGLSVPRTRW